MFRPVYRSVFIYNKLPDSLKTLDSQKAFKSKLKHLLIYKSYYKIDEFVNDIVIYDISAICSVMKMHPLRRANDSVHWFLGELTARVVAESGIPSDRFHLGKIILQSLKDAPDFVSQVDGGTGKSETNRSVLERTVQCATAFRTVGLKQGDVMVLMAPNHLDLIITVYAAFYLGITVAAIERTMNVDDLYVTLKLNKPKIIICQSVRATDVQLTLNKLELDANIVTFDTGDYLCSFSSFLENYGDTHTVANFRPTDFDPKETLAYLIATSGTTGAPKSAGVSHKNLAITGPYLWGRFTEFPTPTRMALIFSPLQWLTAIIHFTMSPIFRYTRLQTSKPFSTEHAYHLLNHYKPTYTVMSPTQIPRLIKPGDRDKCDFTCLDLVMVGGSFVPHTLIEEFKDITPDTEVVNVYGMTELASMGFSTDDPPPGSSGKPLGCFQYRLVDPESQTIITEPNHTGELWVKGPGVFKGYYNDPLATKEVFAEDGWLKTGDMFYRDENWNFFFVERIKLLIKYNYHFISPVEMENVIHQHPGVLDVAVTSVRDSECGELPIACVVRRPDYDVTAQDIKNLVKQSLTEWKELRGVIFLDEIPVTPTSKINRKLLKEIAVQSKIE